MANIKTSTESTYWGRQLLKQKKATSKSAIRIIQNPVGIAGGIAAETLRTISSGEILEDTSLEGLSLMNYTKLWRAKLLMKSSPMAKTNYSPRPGQPQPTNVQNEHYTYSLSPAEKLSQEAEKISTRRDESKASSWEEIRKSSSDSFDFVARKEKANQDSLKRASSMRKNEIIIVNDNVSPYISLVLQNRPNELRITPQGTWVNIASAGRNNPFMMYTGGEDTVSFDISWYASDPKHREEVITKCKLLESWTKADGYLASPPVLQIIWGGSDIFRGQRFILESATYVLSHFQDKTRRVNSTLDNPYGPITDLKLYPNCATQTLTFKKVTAGNTSHSDIIPLEALTGINGIRTQ